MRPVAITLAALYAALSGCATPPAPQDGTGAKPPPAPAPAAKSDAETTPAAALDALEEHHRELAQAAMREGNWADALVRWELLTLIKPASREYRDAITETRGRITASAASLLRSADQARKNGNLDQATTLYLRVLTVDRENTAAAQALREIDAERTKRAYLTRPPRGTM